MQLTTSACTASNIHVGSCWCLPLQRIEAPVRNHDSADKGYAYEGKDISDRQSDVDRLLVDQDQPEEQRFLGTAVAFPDALRFKGAAPEIVNSRYNYSPTPCNTHCTSPAGYACCARRLPSSHQMLFLQLLLRATYAYAWQVQFVPLPVAQSRLARCMTLWQYGYLIIRSEHCPCVSISMFTAGWPCLVLLQH